MSSPSVSVITIFLNPGSFFQEAIESVLTQSFSDWELLLVDDGSNDGSTEVARDFAERETGRVRFLEHPGHENRGMSASRNLGLEQARGELVAYIDADDVWTTDKLTTEVALFARFPDVHMLYSPTVLWRSWRGEPGEIDEQQNLGVSLDTVYPPMSLLPTFLRCTECTPAPTATMVRRKTLVELGGNEDAFRTMYEDQVLFSKVAASFPVYVSSQALAKLRLHENSCCALSLRDRTQLEDRRMFLLWLDRYLDEHGLANDAISRVWQTEWDKFFGWRARFKDHVRPFVPRQMRAWLKTAGYT